MAEINPYQGDITKLTDEEIRTYMQEILDSGALSDGYDEDSAERQRYWDLDKEKQRRWDLAHPEEAAKREAERARFRSFLCPINDYYKKAMLEQLRQSMVFRKYMEEG